MRKIATIVLISLTACSKPDNKPAEQYVFTNTLPQTIKVRLYDAESKIHVNNAYREFEIPGNNSFSIGKTDAKSNSFIEWFSEDYYITNWANRSKGPVNAAETVLPANEWSNQYANKDRRLDRVVWLNGDQLQTVWTSVINKTEKLTLKKDFTIIHNLQGKPDNIYHTICFNGTHNKNPYLDIQLAQNNLVIGTLSTHNGNMDKYRDTLFLKVNSSTIPFTKE